MPWVKVNKDTRPKYDPESTNTTTKAGSGWVKVTPTDDIDRQELASNLAGGSKPYIDPRSEVGGNLLDASAGVTPEQQIDSASKFYQQGRPVQAAVSEFGAGVQQTGKDIAAIPAHYFNQALLNAPRSALETFTRYDYPEDTQSKLAGGVARAAGVAGFTKNLGAKAFSKLAGGAESMALKASSKLGKIKKVASAVGKGKGLLNKGKLVLKADKAVRLTKKAQDAANALQKSKAALAAANKSKHAASIAYHTKNVALLADKASKASTAAKVANNALSMTGGLLPKAGGQLLGFGLKDSRVVAGAVKGAVKGATYGFAYSPEDFGNMTQRKTQAAIGGLMGGLIGLGTGTFKKLYNASTDKGRIKAAEAVRTEVNLKTKAAADRLNEKGITVRSRVDNVVDKVFKKTGGKATKKETVKNLNDGLKAAEFTSKTIAEIADDVKILYDYRTIKSKIQVGNTIENLKKGFHDPEIRQKVHGFLPKDLLLDLKDIKDVNTASGLARSAAGPFIAGALGAGLLGKIARQILP